MFSKCEVSKIPLLLEAVTVEWSTAMTSLVEFR